MPFSSMPAHIVLTQNRQTIDVPRQGVRLTIDSARGAYIEGVVEGPLPGLDVFLEKSDGTRIQKLLPAAYGRHTFRFVADTSHPVLFLEPLGGTQRNNAKTRIQLTRQIEPTDQLPQPSVVPNRTPQSPRLLQILNAASPQKAADEFWEELKETGTPYVEKDPQGDASQRLTTFLWRGAKHNVRLVGGPADDHIWLERLVGTDIWFTSFRTPRQLRLSYQFAPDIPLIPGSKREQRVALLATLQADPLNLSSFGDEEGSPFQKDSYFALDQAPHQPGLLASSTIGVPNDAKGTLVKMEFTSRILGNTRNVWVYRSNGFQPGKLENIRLFIFDGTRYITKASMPRIFDNLRASGQLPPLEAIFIDTIDGGHRDEELTCDEEFGEMMAHELVPFISQSTNAPHAATHTVVAGSSYGGLASACSALNHPDVFGNFISLSGSFWWAPEEYEEKQQPYLVDLVLNKGPTPVRAFFSAGSYEGSRFADVFGILESSKALAQVMQEQGYPAVYFREYVGGHDYAVWRGALADGLISLFGPSDVQIAR